MQRGQSEICSDSMQYTLYHMLQTLSSKLQAVGRTELFLQAFFEHEHVTTFLEAAVSQEQKRHRFFYYRLNKVVISAGSFTWRFETFVTFACVQEENGSVVNPGSSFLTVHSSS